MSNVQIDKKQLPQVIVLGVLSVGCFGYFASRMIAPTAATADGVAPAPVATASTSSSASSTASAPSDQVAMGFIDAPPAPGMRDPFFSSLSPVDPDAPVAPPTPSSAPPLPHASLASLPSMGNVQPLPSIGPAPTAAPLPLSKAAIARAAVAQLGWTVSGVVAPYGNPSASMAVLRSGDERSFVRIGSRVDGMYTVTLITHTGIILQGNGQSLHLHIGGDPSAPPAPAQPIGASVSSGQPAALPSIQPAVPTQAAPLTVPTSTPYGATLPL